MTTRAEMVELRKADARWRVKYIAIQFAYYASVALLIATSVSLLAVCYMVVAK